VTVQRAASPHPSIRRRPGWRERARVAATLRAATPRNVDSGRRARGGSEMDLMRSRGAACASASLAP
jgi:hypothetical protein